MDRQRIKKHILSRVEFVRSGEYRRMFGVEAVVVAYATTGARGERDEERRRRVCSWAMEALREAGREKWAAMFRFCSVSLERMYELPLFDGDVWYRADQEKAAGLLAQEISLIAKATFVFVQLSCGAFRKG